MITPRFSCSQTEDCVVVSVYCPSVRASDVEIHVDETLFTLHINPYYLRLNFSHALVEDDEASARYDPGSGYLTVTLTKAVPGQDFEDLDLLAKLLAPRPSERPKESPLIEVLDSSDNATDVEDDLVARTRDLSLDRQEILEAAQNDWQVKQEVPDSTPTFKIRPDEHYGFLSLYTGYFSHIQHTENEVNELGPDAETCPPVERRRRRLKHEDEKWNDEHYMADYADDEYIQELIRWIHPYSNLPQEFQYTEKENLAMLRLPRKEYLMTTTQMHDIYLTLLTLLFSYAYDCRTMQHEPTPESGWTISVLTPAFSALDPPPYAPRSINNDPATFTESELAATFTPSYRRALAFPLHRSFALAEKCRSDVASFLAGGKRIVFRCLLELKDILDHHDVYYIYSKIWVEDFCLWIQAYASDDTLRSLSTRISSMKMAKNSIGWDLEELEALTREDVDRAEDSDDESEAEVESMIPAV